MPSIEAAPRDGAGAVLGAFSDLGDVAFVLVALRCESRNSTMGIESVSAVYFVEV